MSTNYEAVRYEVLYRFFFLARK